MCTAINFTTRDHYFGRTFDYEKSFGESVIITPRKYMFPFRTEQALIGIGHVAKDYPLYYDAVNESGLAMAGLSFPGNARYGEVLAGMHNVASYELIPYVLGQCENLYEARELLGNINITNRAFSEDLLPTDMHWIVSYKTESIVVERTKEGFDLYDNQIGVMTNNPPFVSQIYNLSNFMHLSAKNPRNEFGCKAILPPQSRGMGAIGLPGDMSSLSRFVRAAFVKWNSVCGESEGESVNQFFHILGTVEQVRGCVQLDDGEFEITRYTSCCNTNKCIYYYKTYENQQVREICMTAYDYKGEKLIYMDL